MTTKPECSRAVPVVAHRVDWPAHLSVGRDRFYGVDDDGRMYRNVATAKSCANVGPTVTDLVLLDDHLAAIAALQKQLTAVTIARHRIMDECNNLTREIDLQWRPKVVALQGQIMDLQQENAALESANEHLNVVNGELTDSLRNGHP